MDTQAELMENTRYNAIHKWKWKNPWLAAILGTIPLGMFYTSFGVAIFYACISIAWLLWEGRPKAVSILIMLAFATYAYNATRWKNAAIERWKYGLTGTGRQNPRGLTPLVPGGVESAHEGAFGFPEAKTDPVMLGSKLSGLIERDSELVAMFLKELPVDVDHDRIRTELRYLVAYAIYRAVSSVVGDTPAGRGVFEGFYGVARVSAAAGNGLSMSDLEGRLLRYDQALQDGCHPGPAINVGTAFAQFCGSEHDALLIGIGSSALGTFLPTMVEQLKRARFA